MQFEIKNRVIKSITDKLVIGDNADYVAHFTFDEEWAGVTKTARFIACNGSYKDVLIENDECKIPCEVLKCGYAKVGVYSAEMTTTEAEFMVIKSIKSDIGCECEPTPNVYEQLTGKLDAIQAGMANEVETYFKDHVDDFKGDKGEKGDAGAIKFVTVAELPTENIEETAIYLLSIADGGEQNKFKEYVFVNGEWECIGTVSFSGDLSDYVKFTDYATDSKVGVVRISNYRGMRMLTGGIIAPMDATTSQINNRNDANSEDVSKTTAVTLNKLDYAIKAGLTTNTETLTDEEKEAAQTWLGIPQMTLTELEDGSYSLDVNTGV